MEATLMLKQIVNGYMELISKKVLFSANFR